MITAVLTIDDIASKNTPAIVDYLVAHNIKAIMFAVGENVERYYDEALYALKNGMIVGNHSYSHPHFSEISFEECVSEIEKCETVLDKLYQDAGVERKYRPFRFPYGDKGGDNNDLLQKYFAENGFDKVDDSKLDYPWWDEQGLRTDMDTYWSFDFAEYNIRPGTGFTKESVWARMDDSSPTEGASLFEDGNNHMLLLHAHDETEGLVPEYYKLFLDYLLEHGVAFIDPKFA